ncbi:MAG: DMT family transporter [Candidatus Hodarchaeota archaeon]
MSAVDSKIKGQLSLGVAIIAVSGAAILVRFCSSSAIIIAFWRLFFALIFLFPFTLKHGIRNQFKPLLNWNYLRIFILSGFFLSLHFFSWFLSLKYTSVAASVIVVNSSPIWVIILSFLIFQDKISKYQFIGLILVFIGLFFIYLVSDLQQSSNEVNNGILLALFGAIMFAIYLIIGKQMRSRYTIPNIPYVFIVNLSCALFLLLIAIFLGENVLSFHTNELIWFIALAIGPSLLGHALLIYSMKYISAQTVSLAVIGETIGASILSWLILKENILWPTLMGGVFVITGIYLSIKFEFVRNSTIRDTS